MSRSYRAAWCVDGYGSKHKKWMKRYSNKAIRRTEEIANGKAYQKIVDSWNISDYRYPLNTKTHWSNLLQDWFEGMPLWKARRK